MDAKNTTLCKPLALRHCATESLCLTLKHCGRSLQLLQQSTLEIMNNRGRFFTTFTSAVLFALCVCAPAMAQRAATQVYLPAKAAAPAPTRTADDSQRLVDQVAAEANARIQAGQPAEDVEAWLGEQLQQAGMTVQTAPPSWDVFGSAAWEQENPGADSADNREPNHGGIATIDGFNSRNPVDGRYEQSEEEDLQISEETGSQVTAVVGQVGEADESQGRQEAAVGAGGGAGGFFVYANEPRRSQEPAARSAAAVRLRAAEVGGEGPAASSAAYHAPGLDSDLRGRSGKPAETPGNPAAGADTD